MNCIVINYLGIIQESNDLNLVLEYFNRDYLDELALDTVKLKWAYHANQSRESGATKNAKYSEDNTVLAFHVPYLLLRNITPVFPLNDCVCFNYSI